MENNIVNILIVATAENRQFKTQDNKIIDLFDRESNIFNDYSSELDNKKDEYFKIIIENNMSFILFKY